MVRGAIAVERRSDAIVGGAIDRSYKLSCDDQDGRAVQLVHRGILSPVWMPLASELG